MRKSDNIILPILVITVSIVILIISISYAYFAEVIDVSNTTSTSVSTGYMDITFTTNNYFNNSNMILIDSASVLSEADYTEFSVGPNGGTVSTIKYDIYFKNLTISNNLKSVYYKWALYQGNTRLNSGDFESIGNATELKLTSSQISMTSASSPVTYRVYVWLENDENVDQNSLLSGNFSGKIAINAYSPRT